MTRASSQKVCRPALTPILRSRRRRAPRPGAGWGEGSPKAAPGAGAPEGGPGAAAGRAVVGSSSVCSMRPRFSHVRRAGVTGRCPSTARPDRAPAAPRRPGASPAAEDQRTRCGGRGAAANVIRGPTQRHRPGEASPLRPGGAAAHHTDMTLRRTIIALCLAMVIVLAIAALSRPDRREGGGRDLSLIHISEPTRLGMISYAVFCLKKKKKTTIILSKRRTIVT